MVQLGPLEVLTALQHAESRLGREFTKEEFVAGTVGQHMLPEDFDEELTISKIVRQFNLPSICEHLG